jgi:hypothetical protein
MRLFNARERCGLRLSGVVERVRGQKAWDGAQRGRTRTRSDCKANRSTWGVVVGRYSTNAGDRRGRVDKRQCLIYEALGGSGKSCTLRSTGLISQKSALSPGALSDKSCSGTALPHWRYTLLSLCMPEASVYSLSRKCMKVDMEQEYQRESRHN